LVALIIVFVGTVVRLAHGQQPKCEISEFYAIAWTTHNPTERHQKMLDWLGSKGPSCKFEQLLHIWNNLSEWAGAADSAPLRANVIELYERLPKK
jgi:hypothetical protein